MTHTAAWQHDAQREETVRLGLWMFLATVAMLFAAFASAYIVRRSGTDWTRINLPPVLWLNTAVLVASSVLLEAGAWNGRRRRWLPAAVALTLAWVFGLAFMGGQVRAWRELMDAGVYLPASPHSSFFYLLTGAHGLHVVAALIVLAVATVRTWRHRDELAWQRLIGATRTFWHFLLAVWLFVFVLISAF